MKSLFLDGRVFEDSLGRYHTPAGARLSPRMTSVFEFGALSAQPMFPVLSREEMRAFSGNELAAIPDDDMRRVWAAIMVRLGAIPEYRKMFEAAYPGTPFAKMTFAHASNAIAGFLTDRLHFNQSPWDRFLAGDNEALSNDQLIDEEYRGIRPAFGYPACPDHSEKTALFSLLDAPAVGIALTEGYSMTPAASVSGLYFSHPQAKYFNVGRIGKDQIEDYAKRKGVTIEDAEKLVPML